MLTKFKYAVILLLTMVLLYISLSRDIGKDSLQYSQCQSVDLDTLVNNQDDYEKKFIKTSGYLTMPKRSYGYQLCENDAFVEESANHVKIFLPEDGSEVLKIIWHAGNYVEIAGKYQSGGPAFDMDIGKGGYLTEVRFIRKISGKGTTSAFMQRETHIVIKTLAFLAMAWYLVQMAIVAWQVQTTKYSLLAIAWFCVLWGFPLLQWGISPYLYGMAMAWFLVQLGIETWRAKMKPPLLPIACFAVLGGFLLLHCEIMPHLPIVSGLDLYWLFPPLFCAWYSVRFAWSFRKWHIRLLLCLVLFLLGLCTIIFLTESQRAVPNAYAISLSLLFLVPFSATLGAIAKPIWMWMRKSPTPTP